jgi:hypothetical protein
MPGLNRLGRNPTNDFRVSDPSVSSFHAELTVEGEEIRVRDLASTNGTFIDGARVEDATLGPKQVLRLGNVRFALEEVSVTPGTARAWRCGNTAALPLPPRRSRRIQVRELRFGALPGLRDGRGAGEVRAHHDLSGLQGAVPSAASCGRGAAGAAFAPPASYSNIAGSFFPLISVPAA